MRQHRFAIALIAGTFLGGAADGVRAIEFFESPPAPTASPLINPNGIDSSGRTALHRACSSGELPTVRALLEDGADVNVVDSTGGTPLSYAARNGSVEVVKLLLAKHASVNLADSRGRTPLICAARVGRNEAITALLESGADLKASDMLKMTALHHAFSNNHSSSAQTLIECGADLQARNAKGKTPIELGPSLNLNVPPGLLAERQEEIARDIARRVRVSSARGPGWNFLRVASAELEARELGISEQQRTAIAKIVKECAVRQREMTNYLNRTAARSRAALNKLWSDALPAAKAELTGEQILKVEAYIRQRESQQMKRVSRGRERAIGGFAVGADPSE